MVRLTGLDAEISCQWLASFLCLSLLVAEIIALSFLEEDSFKGLSFQGLIIFQSQHCEDLCRTHSVSNGEI